MASFVSIPQTERIWHYSLDIVEALRLWLMALTERSYPAPGTVLRVYLQQSLSIVGMGSQLRQRDPATGRNGERGHSDRPGRADPRHDLHRRERRSERRVWLRGSHLQRRKTSRNPAKPLRQRALQRALLPPEPSALRGGAGGPRGRLVDRRKRRKSDRVSIRRRDCVPRRNAPQRRNVETG